MICNIKKGNKKLKRTVITEQPINSLNSGTIDVKEYTSNWGNLTLDNFALVPTTVIQGYSPLGSFQWKSIALSMTYDASTGTLTYSSATLGTPGGYCSLSYEIVLYETI